jgi:hypothetical protein
MKLAGQVFTNAKRNLDEVGCPLKGKNPMSWFKVSSFYMFFQALGKP